MLKLWHVQLMCLDECDVKAHGVLQDVNHLQLVGLFACNMQEPNCYHRTNLNH
jgi:hypothetical protein